MSATDWQRRGLGEGGAVSKDLRTRREFIGAMGGAAAAMATGRAVAQSASDVEQSMDDAKQPNILFIFSDQQRWDTLGCYGDTMGRALGMSPNLDAMAGEGVRFANAFTCQPVCGPARSCIQTGKYATETGCWRNDIALPLDAVTLPRLLKPAGYEVGYIGKWHLASTGPSINHRDKPVPPEYRGGYDGYWLASDVLEFTSHSYDGHMFDGDMNRVEFPEDRYRVDALTDYAIEYLRTRDGSKPFFLFLSYIEPHHQNDRHHFEGPKGSKERFRDSPTPGDLEGLEGDWREEMPDYLGCCASLDQGVGRIRAALDALGIADNTLVFYASDHGCHFRTRNSEYKRSCHEGSVHVPMLGYGPGFHGGRVIEELVSLIDLAPTLLAAGGVAPPSHMRGRPLQALADGAPDDWPQDVFMQISESQIGRAIRTKRWKYSVRAPVKATRENGAAAASYREDFLYDLDADPHEHNNLVREPGLASVRDELCERIKARMADAGEPEPEILPALPAALSG